MKRLICTLLVILMCFTLVACSEEEMNTSTSSEGIVSLYTTSNKNAYLKYVAKLDTTEYEILDVTISQDNNRFAVTTRLKNRWKEGENTDSYKVIVLDGYYIFNTNDVKEYLNFMESFNPEVYEILGISVIPGNSDYIVTYFEK